MQSFYSKKLIDVFTNPKNIGKMKNPDGIGTYQSPVCGDMLTIYIKVKNNKIIDSSFETWGCMVSVGISSAITQIAKGKALAQAVKITKKDLIKIIGQVPPVKAHCVQMSIKALKAAIQDYKKNNKKL